MIRRSVALTAAVIGAVVFTGSTPAQAADQDAVKRAIVTTVLNNLGVAPTDALIAELVRDIPIEVLSPTLVTQVGNSLDSSSDPTLVISQTVDSNGDGIPDADAAMDQEAETSTEDDSGEDSSSGDSSSAGSGATNKPQHTSGSRGDNSTDQTDDSGGNSGGDSNGDSGDDSDEGSEGSSGDDEDN